MVVIDSHRARDSKFVEEIGHYDPSRKILKIDIAEYESWVKKGARPTVTVASLFKKYKKKSK
jgi:small subunit ribosomal protein S16